MSKKYTFKLLIITGAVLAFLAAGCAPVLRKSSGVRVTGDIVKGDQKRNVAITTRNQDRLASIALADPEEDVREALQKLDPVWDELFPTERERIVKLLIKEAILSADGLKIAVRTNGLRSLAAELADGGQAKVAEDGKSVIVRSEMDGILRLRIDGTAGTFRVTELTDESKESRAGDLLRRITFRPSKLKPEMTLRFVLTFE